MVLGPTADLHLRDGPALGWVHLVHRELSANRRLVHSRPCDARTCRNSCRSVAFPSGVVNTLYLVAIATGVGWEIFEHSDFVIRQFRYGTVNQGYTGDSVLNAVSDYMFMMSGFYLAAILPTVWVAALVITLESTATLVARDGFILEAIMLVHQFEAIEEWQLELKPDHLKQ